MILTTYRVHQIDENNFWYLTEGLASDSHESKKVVIHQVEDGVIGWQSSFGRDTQAAFEFWRCLQNQDFDPDKALELFKTQQPTAL